jgi:hypothetical protein
MVLPGEQKELLFLILVNGIFVQCFQGATRTFGDLLSSASQLASKLEVSAL